MRDGGAAPHWGSFCTVYRVVPPTVAAAICRWNYGVIAPGNHYILIRCAEHHHPARRAGIVVRLNL